MTRLQRARSSAGLRSGLYRADGYGGWMMVLRAARLRDAERIARASAGSASLLPGDIHTVRPATADDLREYEAMGGQL